MLLHDFAFYQKSRVGHLNTSFAQGVGNLNQSSRVKMPKVLLNGDFEASNQLMHHNQTFCINDMKPQKLSMLKLDILNCSQM